MAQTNSPAKVLLANERMMTSTMAPLYHAL